jgi:hypothetical protein
LSVTAAPYSSEGNPVYLMHFIPSISMPKTLRSRSVEKRNVNCSYPFTPCRYNFLSTKRCENSSAVPKPPLTQWAIVFPFGRYVYENHYTKPTFPALNAYGWYLVLDRWDPGTPLLRCPVENV